MCGRARCTLGADGVAAACGFDPALRTQDSQRYVPSYNVGPGAYLPVVRYEREGDNNEPVVHCMKWGLVPSFTKKGEKPDHFRMFNARSETLHEKASFNRLLPKQRCLVCVEGFYEWKKEGSKKQPFYIHFKDGRPFVMAALYDTWQNGEGETLFTFTILTTVVSKHLQWLHDRMPVILGRQEDMTSWIDAKMSGDKFSTLTKPYEVSDLTWYAVTPAIGKLSFNGPECTKQIKLPTVHDNPISKLFAKKRKLEESSSFEDKKSIDADKGSEIKRCKDEASPGNL